MSVIRGLRLAAILLVAASNTALAEDAQAKLLQELDTVIAEDAAQALVTPFMDKIKTLKPEVVEKIVQRQWWGLATELVAKGHEQGADLSFPVRKATKKLKDAADELVRTLNPKYGQAQQVSPAFQWAQNDTSVFLTVKYTVRWNAPGALEVTEPSVNMTGNLFNFSGLGKHSNNKYKYWLSLSMFDNINPEQSTWSAASVGKLSVMFRKKWARKWPRLLANKKTKIGNMHIWSERQEALDDTLSGMSTVSFSPVTCAASDKLYCLATDTCKKKDACAQCPGKTTPQLEEHLCTGIPSEKAGLSFKDTDMTENKIGGDLKVTKARNDFDIDWYEIFWGKDGQHKVEGLERIAASPATGADNEVKIAQGTSIPEGATHFLVFSRNAFGEYSQPGSVLLQDAVLPEGKPTSLTFEDEDGDKGELSGEVKIGKAENDKHLEEYQLYWGKSERKKIGSSPALSSVRKAGDKDPTYRISKNTKIPEGASHILVCTKNKWGDHPVFVSLKIEDNVKPCANRADSDCPQGVAVAPGHYTGSALATASIVTITRASSEAKLTHYSLYWGREGCEGKSGQSGAKNGHLKEIDITDQAVYEVPAGTVVPSGTTHILAFSKGKIGESEHCVSAPFKDETKKEL